MVTIKNNKITMTRGDSLNVKVAIVKNKSSRRCLTAGAGPRAR